MISLLLFISLVIVKLLVGYEKDRNRYKKDAVMSIFIYVMTYFIIIYIIGFFIGFLLSPYSFSFINIVKNITPVLLIIFVSEILRYAINKKGEKSNLILIGSVILFVLLDITFVFYSYDLTKTVDIIELLTLVVIQSISTNILLTYNSLKFGYLPNIVYRVILEISIFLIPIIPNFGEYIQAVIDFVLPIVVLFLLFNWYKKKLAKKEEKKDYKKSKNGMNVGFSIFTVLFILVIVYLTSGFFKYYALSIGSPSMEPTINKGDVAIVEKIDDVSTLKNGDVLVYEKEDIVIVHTIVEVITDGVDYSFITKGDNNEDVDNWVVSKEQVIGIVKFKIKYIGYPTVWLSEAVK